MFKRLKARREFKVMVTKFNNLNELGSSVYTLERQIEKMERRVSTEMIFAESRHEFQSEIDGLKEITVNILNSYRVVM